jgi:FkbM family methyltransferase
MFSINHFYKSIGYIIGRKKFFKFGLILQHISHRMMGIGNHENMIVSGESYVLKHILNNQKNNKPFIFIDIGAGTSSEQSEILINHFPKFQAILFEPMPKRFKILKDKYASHNTVKAINVAISDKNGFLILYDYKKRESGHASVHRESLKLSNEPLQKIKVEVKSLKKVMSENKISYIDFLKIDTEGHEYQIISGLGKKITSIKYIQFEFNFMNIYSKTTFNDFYNLLSKEFNIYRIYQDGLLKIEKYQPIYQEIYEFQNYLAVNKNI